MGDGDARPTGSNRLPAYSFGYIMEWDEATYRPYHRAQPVESPELRDARESLERIVALGLHGDILSAHVIAQNAINRLAGLQ